MLEKRTCFEQESIGDRSYSNSRKIILCLIILHQPRKYFNNVGESVLNIDRQNTKQVTILTGRKTVVNYRSFVIYMLLLE